MGGRKRGTSLAEPTERGRPHAPGYGIRTDAVGLLPWSFVEERMAAAREYWVATVHPDGRTHRSQVWGLWVDRDLYFGSGSRTRKARNLAENPNVAVHPEGDDVVILEGVAEVVTDPDPALSERFYAASAAKYGMAPAASRVPTPCARASRSP